ncbi:acyl-CoA 6-desaturase-like [Asterias rubens]|uniref:acyl-CoA 6-desaturase-like n=1 Tax=Asterias rubens TaxID=7604 RepID=UPI00145558E3|nr:acyl-CoA 6-desaturase-like [Asterias rubens]XP_033628618.1 acyl-CoA 6-desaturase-like [Asterias rubens]
MGKGQQGQSSAQVSKKSTYTWDEVKEHSSKTDKWVVIENGVYDVSKWVTRHPGGFKVLSHYAGEDATDAFVAFHPDKELVTKYLKPLCIGSLEKDNKPKSSIVTDMRDLRSKVEQLNLLKPNLWFYAAHLGHILALDVLGWFVMWYFGTGWLPYLTSAFLLLVVQGQSGWFQHDLGHLSVFKKSSWNHALHGFILGGMKGSSAHWWNYRHFQHHAKPNIIMKDPDIRMEYIFMLGEQQPVQWAKKKKGFMPYDHQQSYFFFILPPLLLPLYFHYEYTSHILRKKVWIDVFWMVFFFTKLFVTFGPLLGVSGAFFFYLFVRFMESHWFVWVTQMNHIPMKIDYDDKKEWLPMQLQATCNVDPSFFNDWFTGHLNYQIEHHLFPTMPRHNFHKIVPDVKALCKKHGLPYQTKTLFCAFADIVRSLKRSGEIWHDAYYHT